MSEWWRYRPSDFLMFSARTWGRLVESWNEALWPWQLPVLAIAAVLLVLVARQRARVPAVLALAVAWAWVGWAFQWERFAEVNTGARWLAGAFGTQAVLLVALGSLPAQGWPSSLARKVGLAVAAAALVLYPLAAPLTGAGWRQSELVGALPDPTALYTVGLLLALPVRFRAVLLVVPVLALVVGWTTAWLLRAG